MALSRKRSAFLPFAGQGMGGMAAKRQNWTKFYLAHTLFPQQSGAEEAHHFSQRKMGSSLAS